MYCSCSESREIEQMLVYYLGLLTYVVVVFNRDIIYYCL